MYPWFKLTGPAAMLGHVHLRRRTASEGARMGFFPRNPLCTILRQGPRGAHGRQVLGRETHYNMSVARGMDPRSWRSSISCGRTTRDKVPC